VAAHQNKSPEQSGLFVAADKSCFKRGFDKGTASQASGKFTHETQLNLSGLKPPFKAKRLSQR